MRIKQMLLGALVLVCACAFGEEAKELGVKGGASGAAARKLQSCDFLLNKDFKKINRRLRELGYGSSFVPEFDDRA